MSSVLIKSGNFLKEKVIIKQFLKYSIVGITNSIIGFGTIFIVYNFFHANYILANIFGYALGLVNSFVWNKKWTFKSTRHSSKEVTPFILIFLLSYAVNLITVIASVEFLKIEENVSQVIGMCFYTATNFLSNRRWTFRHTE